MERLFTNLRHSEKRTNKFKEEKQILNELKCTCERLKNRENGEIIRDSKGKILGKRWALGEFELM